VYCGKTADGIQVPFGIVSGVGRGMGVLDEGCNGRRIWAVLGVNLGRIIVCNQWGLCCIVVREQHAVHK